jgi:RNA recognition motif-containing protein
VKQVFVGNLNFGITEEDDLKRLFASFGEITEAKIITDARSYCSKGYGFVSFTRDADAAIAGMNGKVILGRPLRCAAATRGPYERARGAGRP